LVCWRTYTGGTWWRVTTGWGFVVVAPLQTVHGIGGESRRGSPSISPRRERSVASAAAASSPNPRSQVVLCRSHTGRFGICCCCNHPCSIGAGCVVASSQSSSVLCRPFHFLLSHLFPPPPSPAPPFFFPFLLKKKHLACLFVGEFRTPWSNWSKAEYDCFFFLRRICLCFS